MNVLISILEIKLKLSNCRKVIEQETVSNDKNDENDQQLLKSKSNKIK